jgi:hypothetical protein
MSGTEQGWVAECQDCPTTTDPDYGHQVKVHQEFAPSNYDDAVRWAFLHASRSGGHRVDIRRFARIPFEVTDMNPEVTRALFGSDR